MAQYRPLGSEEPRSALDNRLDSPVIAKEVLRPLEERIHEYSSLMHRAYEEQAYIDEEIRRREERKFVAQNQLEAARAKREDYQRKYRAIEAILDGHSKQNSPYYEERQKDPTRGLPFHCAGDDKPDKPPRGLFLEPSTRLTYQQVFYILVMHGIGSMIISGGVNFGLAYGKFPFVSNFLVCIGTNFWVVDLNSYVYKSGYSEKSNSSLWLPEYFGR
jgi:hypothetical protein